MREQFPGLRCGGNAGGPNQTRTAGQQTGDPCARGERHRLVSSRHLCDGPKASVILASGLRCFGTAGAHARPARRPSVATRNFTGFHRVNGFNYWKEDEGRQRFVKLLNVTETRESVGWTALVE